MTNPKRKKKRIAKFRPTLAGTEVSQIITALRERDTANAALAHDPSLDLFRDPVDLADRLTVMWGRWYEKQKQKRNTNPKRRSS